MCVRPKSYQDCLGAFVDPLHLSDLEAAYGNISLIYTVETVRYKEELVVYMDQDLSMTYQRASTQIYLDLSENRKWISAEWRFSVTSRALLKQVTGTLTLGSPQA